MIIMIASFISIVFDNLYNLSINHYNILVMIMIMIAIVIIMITKLTTRVKCLFYIFHVNFFENKIP